MYNFRLPITKTLLTPNTRKLTLDELLQAFPEGKDRRGDFADGYEGEVFFSLDPASSPYGDALDVVFVDPEIPVDYAKESTHPDLTELGSVSFVKRVRQSKLFTGGYLDYSHTLVDFCPQFMNARYLLGNSTIKNGRPAFLVGGKNCSDMLVLVPRKQIENVEVPLEIELSFILSSPAPGDQHALEIDLMSLLKQEDDIKLLSSMHYQDLVRNIMSQFPQKFEYVCRDNGVKYDEAWMIDWYGNEIPPDLVEKRPLTSAGEGGYTRKTWLHPEQFICCVCYTDFDSEVKLVHQCLQYEKHGDFGPNTNNELVRRRLGVIRRQIGKKLQENWLLFSDNLNGFVEPHWNTCSYYGGIKMQL